MLVSLENFKYIQDTITTKTSNYSYFLRNSIFYLVWSNNNDVHVQFHTGTLYMYMIELTM